MDLSTTLPILLGAAWLLPLASFTIIVFLGPKLGKAASYVATGAIVSAAVLSWIALGWWMLTAEPVPDHHAAVPSQVTPAQESSIKLVSLASKPHADAEHADAEHHEAKPPRVFTDNLYTLGQFGDLKITVSYYIDALTVAMFAMVTLIASCIHFYAIGYMHDELHPITDHEVIVTKKSGHGHGEHGHDEHGHGHDDHGHDHAHDAHSHAHEGHEDTHGHDDHAALPPGQAYLHRPGRFHRFFQYLSLFCFSMLGLVYAGNVAMVFVFWELVGICSYFLIGFYIERKSASNAANKAFIVNRVGDFGMIIGLMALWAGVGTFAFGDIKDASGKVEPGIFSQVRPADGHNDYALRAPDRMVQAEAGDRVAEIVRESGGNVAAAEKQIAAKTDEWRAKGYGYWLLVIGGLGIFCGCVGKSAQFPLHVWLPDAMEGPTPVSALVHSATMVAAGVYLVGRFFPVFTQEVLLVIAYTGCITLFLAATIAITAVDIKRVLAYSTVSQLGYMMLALGIGGWLAGLFHLFTHAFFKSLLFMCSGSVIHATHTNDMTRMGGLLKKMPYTGYTMLVGCLAIIGTGIPFVAGFSGYYSKDSIIAQALSFTNQNPNHRVLFLAAAGGASITAFYMFRLWYLTFIGKPRDEHVYSHVHESPKVMYYPLIVLSVFAIAIGWPMFELTNLLEQARPAGTIETATGALVWENLVHPSEHISHTDKAIHSGATWVAFSTALAGFMLATIIYAWRLLNPTEIKQQFKPIYTFLWNKWYFDELYWAIFVRPTHFVSGLVSKFDRQVIDGLINGSARVVKRISSFDDMLDRYVVDGLVNLLAHWTFATGRSLRKVQTGRLRQYVMFIVIGAVALTVVIKWSLAAAP